MKIFAATMLALAAAAINLKEGTDGPELDPCPDMPEGAEDASPDQVFDYIDRDGSGDIGEREGL